MRFISFSTFLIFFLVASPLSSETNEEEEFFNILSSHEFFSASFFQRTSKNELERNIQGKIIADRSGRFKLNYFEPLNEIIFSDGKDLYRYDPELDQAYVQPLDDLLMETPLGLFVLSTEELKQFLSLDWCKDIKPFMRCRLSFLKDISFVREIVVEIKDKVIHQLSYRDTFNQNVTLIFHNPSTEKIAPGQFQVIIPKGTDIVSFKNTLE